MDDILNQIHHARELTRDIETNLPHLVDNPPLILSSCRKIVGALNKAMQGLHSLSASHSSTQVLFGETLGSHSDIGVGSSMDIRAGEGSSRGGSYMQAIDLLRGPSMEEDNPLPGRGMPESETGVLDFRQLGLELQATSVAMGMMDIGSGPGGCDGTTETNVETFGRVGGEAPVATEGSSGSGRRPAGSLTPRSSRRR